MSRIPQNFIDDLLNRVDIVDVVDQRVKLKKTGKNYAACCPFHKEKTPSFTVSPDKQFYYCFGCGASGNAVGFVMEFDRVGFVDAIENLARQSGMQVPKEDDAANKKFRNTQKSLYDILEKANTYYQTQLKEHPNKQKAVTYLKGRGLTGHIAKDFGIGYAPPGWGNLLLRLGTNEEDQKLLRDSGLIVTKEEENKQYDRFRNRITFPIRDTRGRVIGFGGRVLGDDKPKYLNSPETPVFHKGRELYGLHEARKNNRNLENLLVVEGYMDVIALAQYDIQNAVATLGTACGEDHLKLAFKYVDEVVFCFDGDAAGRNAAKRALTNSLSSMEDGRQIKFLFLPEGQDPDSLVRQIGRDRLLAQIKAAIPLEEFLFDAAAEGIDLNTMDGRARFSKVAKPMLDQLPQGVFRSLMIGNLAKRTGLSKEELDELPSESFSFLETPTEKKPEESESLASQADFEQAPQIQSEHASPQLEPQNLAAQHEMAPPPQFEPDFADQTPNQTFYDGAIKPSSSILLNPVKRAMTLILDTPALLQSTEDALKEFETDNHDVLNLKELMEYLKKRPSSNFNNIIGYWFGTYGAEAQQQLTELMANQEFKQALAMNSFDAKRELEDCIKRINRQFAEIPDTQSELTKLKQKGLQNLSDEEKNRFRELTMANLADKNA